MVEENQNKDGDAEHVRHNAELHVRNHFQYLKCEYFQIVKNVFFFLICFFDMYKHCRLVTCLKVE